MTLCEVDIEVSHERLDIVVPAADQMEWRREVQIVIFDRVHIHLLETRQAESDMENSPL